MRDYKKIGLYLLIGILIGFVLGRVTVLRPTVEPTPSATPVIVSPETTQPSGTETITEDGIYDTKDEVALYIHTYGHLPKNYMTKEEAKKEYGWSGGSLHLLAENKCIGGNEYYNFEGLLPDIGDMKYYECDIDTLNRKKRGAKRIVFSEDGKLIYYTADHYDSFECLYGEESK